MFCSNCGKEIDDNTKFCSYCGVSLKKIKNKKPWWVLVLCIVAISLPVLVFILFLIAVFLPSHLMKQLEDEYVFGAKKAVSVLNQVITMNLALDNEAVENLDAKQLTDYFEKRLNIERKFAPNKIELTNGMIFEFLSDGSCLDGGCSVIVDINGERGPNKIWRRSDEPQDRIIIELTDINVRIPWVLKKYYRLDE